MQLYLISASCLRVWELSCHELKENNSIGIDIRLETVRVVILHPDNLRSLWNPKQITEKYFFFPFGTSQRISLELLWWKHNCYWPSRGWTQRAAPPDVNRSIWPSLWRVQSLQFSLLVLRARKCLRCCQGIKGETQTLTSRGHYGRQRYYICHKELTVQWQIEKILLDFMSRWMMFFAWR